MTEIDTTAPTALVVGVGPERGLGAALCRRFAVGGYHVLIGGRTASKIETVAQTITANGGRAEPIVVDATQEDQIIRLLQHANQPAAGREPLDLVVSNPGPNQRIDFLDVSATKLEEFWRVSCLTGFLIGREAVRHMLPRGSGTILFTGASASLRGKPGFAHFAAAKAGLRMIAQSMAREYSPHGLHVAHVVVDGGIDGDRLGSRRQQRIAERGEDSLLDIDAIAEVYWQIHRQPRSTWTQEIDLRPFTESF
jgi:NAD(P)-dependent dehydrogenase (short-subunit alcohol dehydrogenase family)